MIIIIDFFNVLYRYLDDQQTQTMELQVCDQSAQSYKYIDEGVIIFISL
jgi:hypothetical protein